MTAAQYLKAALPIQTTLKSADIETHIPAALREQSFFSATTMYAEHLTQTQADIAKALDGELSPAQIRTNMKMRLAALDYQPKSKDKGTLQDLSSDARTALVINQNQQRARGYAKWRSMQNDTALQAFPAQELYRAIASNNPRAWKTRWNDARADLGEGNTTATYATSDSGPFIALVNDPIWSAISRFGMPYDPFDFNSGMRLRPVTRKVAIDAGVMQDEALVAELSKPAADPMETEQEASTEGMDEELVKEWAKPFEGRAVVADGRIAIAPPPATMAALQDATAAARAVVALTGRNTAGLPPATKIIATPKAPANLQKIIADGGEWSVRGSQATFRAKDGTRHFFDIRNNALEWKGTEA